MKQQFKIQWLLGVLVCLCLIGWVGCGDDPPAKPPVEEPKEDKAAKKPKEKAAKSSSKKDEPMKEYKRPEAPANTRRDPFVFEPPKPKEEEDTNPRPEEPLEQFELAQLELVAIITGTTVPKAMFLDSTRFGHVAKEGDRIGKDGGRITDIRSNEVEVTIGGVRRGGVADELEVKEGEGRTSGEPVTVVIRLTDTDIVMPEEDPDEKKKTVIEELDGQQGSE